MGFGPCSSLGRDISALPTDAGGSRRPRANVSPFPVLELTAAPLAPTLAPVLRRGLVGLGKGGLIGALVALALVFGAELTVFGGLWSAVSTVALAGALTGLVAGRPIWSPGARIEAWLKAVAGAFLGVGLLFLLRRYVGFDLTLPAALGQGSPGELPLLALPAVAAVLGALFEVDHSGDAEPPPPERARSRAAPGPGRHRVGADEAADTELIEGREQSESRGERRRS